MQKLVLYCKSYKNDVLRARRLAESVSKFNVDGIPFYISMPQKDFELFQQYMDGLPVNLIKDEDIIAANPKLDQGKIDRLPGSKSQQIIKSEFWRLNLTDSYVCLDSDCFFIKKFHYHDFISENGTPYTVIHEGKELLQFVINQRINKVYENYHIERLKIMNIFERKGKFYDFGPSPFIWSSDVWRALDENFLEAKNINFYDAILLFPSEILWYGESLLKYLPINLIPIEPLFKVYHLERQFIDGRKNGEFEDCLTKNFFGICYQSNWEKHLDVVKKPLSSRIGRWLRRNILHRY